MKIRIIAYEILVPIIVVPCGLAVIAALYMRCMENSKAQKHQMKNMQFNIKSWIAWQNLNETSIIINLALYN